MDEVVTKEPAYPVTTSWLVVRHAESQANAGGYFASQSDSLLTERGERQSEALVHALEGVGIDVVYSSDLTRAKATGAPLARALGHQVILTPVLRERHMGVLTGMTFEQAKREHPEVWARLLARDPTVAPEGGETHIGLGERVRGFLEETGRRHRGQTILLVSHGVTIHHVVRQLMGVHDLSLPLWLSVDNASITRVDVVEPASGVVVPRLAYVNRVPAMDGRVIPM